jgi:transcription termination factor Rho
MPARKKTHSAAAVQDVPVEKTSVEDIVGKPSSAEASEGQATEETSKVEEVPVIQAVQDEPKPEASREFSENRYEQQPAQTYEVHGILDIQPEGHGFLRPRFIPSQRDIYISQSQIRRFMLRPGDLVAGVGRPPKDTERYFGLLKVETVNDMPAEESLNRPYFDELTPVYPKKQVVLTTGKHPLSTRIIDLIAPIGFGQRGMIVSPPKAGKTTILKELAAGISQNFPQVHLMAALIGERPEEVTDITSSVKGEVVASNFDEPPEDQTRVAEITLDRAKRMVEMGKDVIILLDSITRLARAYNLSVAPSGRTLSGGFDPAALWPAKKFFGAARNCQEGGSLTIIGTALVDTGSRMDDLIYEEFKGTGNMELHLDRRLADKRIYPSIDIEASGTRQEELVLAPELLQKLTTMRRMLYMLGDEERTQLLIEKLDKTETNNDFLDTLKTA